MIKLEKVSHAYGRGVRKVQSLQDISIEIGDEFLAIVGPSGSGKSTILKILAGFEQPSSGQVMWDGMPNVAMVFQDYSLLPWLSVRSNVELYPRLQEAPDEARAQVSNTLMEQLGLSAYANLLPHELSGGMQQRVAIGRAFAQSPDVLLMDEPFGALDAMTRAEAQSVLLQVYAERRCTVKLASNAVDRQVRLKGSPALLTGRIFDDRGNRMTPTHANKRGVHYRYYVSHALLQKRAKDAGSVARVPAPDVEWMVAQALRAHLADTEVEAPDPTSDRDLIEHHVERVILRRDAVEVHVGNATDVQQRGSAHDKSGEERATTKS